MPGIDLHKHMDWFALRERVEGNMYKVPEKGGFTWEIKRAMLSKISKKRIGCPPDREFRQSISTKSQNIAQLPLMILLTPPHSLVRITATG